MDGRLKNVYFSEYFLVGSSLTASILYFGCVSLPSFDFTLTRDHLFLQLRKCKTERKNSNSWTLNKYLRL